MMNTNGLIPEVYKGGMDRWDHLQASFEMIFFFVSKELNTCGLMITFD